MLIYLSLLNYIVTVNNVDVATIIFCNLYFQIQILFPLSAHLPYNVATWFVITMATKDRWKSLRHQK